LDAKIHIIHHSWQQRILYHL